MSARPPRNRNASLRFWRVIETWLTQLFAIFGAPEAIAAHGELRVGERARLLSWLRGGEALMRRLLLLEAAAFVTPFAAKPKPRRTRTARVRAPAPFDPNTPDTWRVSFRALPDRTWRAPRSSRPRGPRRTLYPARPLAERCEALRRVFNDPLPYARRLARRLQADPPRARALVTPPLPARHAALDQAAARAAPVFDTG